jgi:hypothetical protein
VQDNDCRFASLLVVVHKKDDGIRMAGYHQLRLSEDSSKVTAVITPWGVYRFLACPFGISTTTGALVVHQQQQ